MKSLREAIRYSPFHPLPTSVRAIAAHLSVLSPVPHPIKLSNLIARLEVKDLSKVIETDAALGGHVGFTFSGDGSYHFYGDMRATGALSYTYQLQAFVQGASGVALVAQHSGSVYGTDSPGERQDEWHAE